MPSDALQANLFWGPVCDAFTCKPDFGICNVNTQDWALSIPWKTFQCFNFIMTADILQTFMSWSHHAGEYEARSTFLNGSFITLWVVCGPPSDVPLENIWFYFSLSLAVSQVFIMSHENLNNGKFNNFCVNQIYLDVCHGTQWRFKIKTKLLIRPFRFWIRLFIFLNLVIF